MNKLNNKNVKLTIIMIILLLFSIILIFNKVYLEKRNELLHDYYSKIIEVENKKVILDSKSEITHKENKVNYNYLPSKKNLIIKKRI